MLFRSQVASELEVLVSSVMGDEYKRILEAAKGVIGSDKSVEDLYKDKPLDVQNACKALCKRIRALEPRIYEIAYKSIEKEMSNENDKKYANMNRKEADEMRAREILSDPNISGEIRALLERHELLVPPSVCLQK